MARRGNPLGVEVYQDFTAEYDRFRLAYQQAYEQLTEWYSRFGGTLEEAKDDANPPTSSSAFYSFVEGRRLSEVVLATRAIPPKKTSAFSKLFKELHRSRRPKTYTGWYLKHLPALALLLESNTWSPIGETPDVKIALGPFTVINQTGLDPTATLKLLTTAHDLVRDSGVPNVSATLYGDVYLVGDIQRKKTIAALYFHETDTIEIVVVKRFAKEAIRIIIHELGHRYWRRIGLDKKAWVSHDTRLHLGTRPELPKIGETLQYVPGSPVVTGYTETKILVAGGHIGTRQYLNVVRANETAARFPTPYAASNAEEHFCEAFSLYCIGELAEPHRSAFEAIVVHGRTSNPRERNLARGLVL